jgi:hypothetical protein
MYNEKLPLPCVMFPSLHKFLPESYDVGWLIPDETEPYILRWGNTKNKDMTIILAENLVKEQGERLVLRYDKPLEMEKYERKIGFIAINSRMMDKLFFESVVLYQYPVKESEYNKPIFPEEY